MQAGLDFKAADCVLLFVQFFASRAWSRCKHDMGALLWLNAETFERAATLSLAVL